MLQGYRSETRLGKASDAATNIQPTFSAIGALLASRGSERIFDAETWLGSNMVWFVASSGTPPIGVSAGGFHSAAALQRAGDEPAKERPDEAGEPAGEDVGWIVDTEVDARESHGGRERDGDREHVDLERHVRDDGCQERTHREVNDGRQHRVSAGEAAGVNLREMRDEIGARTGVMVLQEHAN